MLITGEIEKLAKYLKILVIDELRILEPIPCGSLLDEFSEILNDNEKNNLLILI